MVICDGYPVAVTPPKFWVTHDSNFAERERPAALDLCSPALRDEPPPLSLPLRAPAAARPTPPAAASQSQSYSFQRTVARTDGPRIPRRPNGRGRQGGEGPVGTIHHGGPVLGLQRGPRHRGRGHLRDLRRQGPGQGPGHGAVPGPLFRDAGTRCVRTLSDIPLERVKKLTTTEPSLPT